MPDETAPLPDWPRPIVHWAIEAVDVEAQGAFYRELFSWNVGEGPFPTIDAGYGGPEPGPAGHLQPAGTPRISLWIQVRDLEETLTRAAELGGTVTATPFRLGEGPTLASIEDPEGNPLGLVQQ